ncbi:MAG: ArsR family transcriptional regulator [Nitrososphaerales archaeon]
MSVGAEVSKVLSSSSRWKILEILAKGPKDIKAIVKETGIQPTAVRYHIQSLHRLGLVETYEEKGTIGRPRIYYKLSKKQISLGFPARNYILLATLLIEAIKQNLGTEEAKKLIHIAGVKKGKELVEELTSKYNITKWKPHDFKSIYIEDYLTQIGVQPEVVKMSSDRIVFREHSCQFLELATKYPDLVCDVLDTAIHSGISEALKDVKITKTKCMGHGDEFCEYTVSWKKS